MFFRNIFCGVRMPNEYLSDADFLSALADLRCDKGFFIDNEGFSGGTVAFFNNNISRYNKSGLLFCIKYNFISLKYVCEIYWRGAVIKRIERDDADSFFALLDNIRPNKIMISVVLCWPDTRFILRWAAGKRSRDCKVIFFAHSFLCACPRDMLMTEGLQYCGLPESCDACAQNCPYMNSQINVRDWRGAWGEFFRDGCDEITVFSQSTGKLITKIYPFTADKIKVVPHFVPHLRRAQIGAHSGINIAVLGDVSYAYKGSAIIDNMAAMLPSGVNLILIGTDMQVPNTKNVGKYRREDLPKIMEENDIDIVFIPSIWPETFSYTTAEAMKMNLPVACFDLGAPAERVAGYAKGLIISEIRPEAALREIVEYVEYSKNETVHT
ncbi:MAG: glycosyltransferase [Rickettsiales bacterium]|jgi:glycosyltransferase involved in cell wall biosynthesis|nr:glycosyltransferase [Rickettsiales bacterium]